MYDYLDLRQTERLKELVPYKVLAPDADEIIKELERLNNIINELEKYIIDEIDDAQEELNIILQGDNLDYKNECTKEFNCIKNALDMLLNKLKALKEE